VAGGRGRVDVVVEEVDDVDAVDAVAAVLEVGGGAVVVVDEDALVGDPFPGVAVVLVVDDVATFVVDVVVGGAVVVVVGCGTTGT
jgi:hypothetical protein